MLTQIIRTVVTTAVREITRQSIHEAFLKRKPKEKRNSYYKGKK